jgi:hypothetical protein
VLKQRSSFSLISNGHLDKSDLLPAATGWAVSGGSLPVLENGRFVLPFLF